MTDSIDEIYSASKQIAKKIESAVLISASEDLPLQIGGTKEVPQVIEIEFGGPVPDEYKLQFLELVNGTDRWQFVDEDNVFEGKNEGHGLITISRDIPVEEFNQPEYDESDYF